MLGAVRPHAGPTSGCQLMEMPRSFEQHSISSSRLTKEQLASEARAALLIAAIVDLYDPAAAAIHCSRRNKVEVDEAAMAGNQVTGTSVSDDVADEAVCKLFRLPKMDESFESLSVPSKRAAAIVVGASYMMEMPCIPELEDDY